MSEEIELTIREAVPDDAEALLTFLNKVVKQTDYLLDNEEVSYSVEEQRKSLHNLYESDNNLLVVAYDKQKIVGTTSISASSKERIRHIGEVGIVVDQAYWGMGLGSLLIEDAVEWARSSPLKRLELDVQERNQRAIRLYERFGFSIEAKKEYGVKVGNDYLPTLLMSYILED
jgi:RimJ/RimL family protein N-acetyltransferase